MHATAAVPPTGTRSVVFNKRVCSLIISLPGLRQFNSNLTIIGIESDVILDTGW